MQGLEGGMEDDVGSVFKTVSNISNAIVDEMESQTPHMAFALDATMNGINGATHELGRIASIFGGIAEMLARIGGFRVPDVAAGSVVPYRARIAADTLAAGTLDEFTTNFDETMSDQADILKDLLLVQREARDHLKNLKSGIGITELTKGIMSEQRAIARAFGG
jgi:hypothetical protein